MMESATVAAAWKELEAEGSSLSNSYRVSGTGVHLTGGQVLFGLDSKGQRHLLLPIHGRDGAEEDRKSSGVHIVYRELLEGWDRKLFADVICRKPHLHELFSILVTEMLDRVKDSGDPHPAKICSEVLDRWRELLEGISSPLLGIEVLTGLFGELWHLREILKLDSSKLHLWRGPEGARHDISSGVIAIEVKATVAAEGTIFTIHGHRQLEPPLGGRLFLATLQLELADAGGESVPDLIESINEVCDNSHLLFHKLSKVGYRIEDAETYSGIRFGIIKHSIYLVDDSFPRIIPASFTDAKLPAGVVRLDYQIDLSGAAPEPLPELEHEHLYRALLAGGGHEAT